MEAVTIILPNHQEPQVAQTIAALWLAIERRHLLDVRICRADDPKGRGVGWAMRQGLRVVSTPWVVFAMADGSEDPDCVAEMIAQCSPQVACVWGDRWGPGGRVDGFPPLKRILNRLGNRLIAWTQGSVYTDFTDLAKAYRTADLRSIRWSDDFRCEIEIPLRARQLYGNLAPITIVPMHWTERTAGRSTYRLSRVGVMLWTLWRVWRRG